MKSKFLLIVVLFMLIGRQLHAAAPVITAFSPAAGPVGTLVTITGTNLTAPTTFTIGGVNAIVVSNSGTQLVAIVMPGASTGAIAIANAGGSVTSTSNFTITTRVAVNMVQNGGVLESVGSATGQAGAVAISADGKTAVLTGVPGTSSPLTNVAQAFIFTFAADNWTLQATLQGTGEFGNTTGGVAISADGNTVLLGSPNDNGYIGYTFVFTRTGATWAQQGPPLVGTGATGDALQGTSVALSADGNTAAIGATNDNTQVGATWVFTRTAGVWTQQGGKLVGSGYAGNALQGSAVALSADGNTLIVGGPNDNTDIGAAWIFGRSGGTWTQQGAKLSGNDVITGNYVDGGLGVALSADGNTAAVGGPGDNNGIGAVWIYTRSGTAWTQQGSKLTCNSTYKYPRTGSSVALSADGNLLLTGAESDYTPENGGALNVIGSAFEFTRVGPTWTQLGTKLVGIAGQGTNAYDQQGLSIALSADGITGLVGAPGYLNDKGAAFVYTTTSPSATTLPATAITTTTASINGSVDEDVAQAFSGQPNYSELVTTVTMVYSTSPTLATKTTATLTTGTSPMPGGTSVSTFASALTGLTPGTTYYFMISGVNAFGTANGSILSFTTTAAALLPDTIKFNPLANRVYGATSFLPGATATNTSTPITYTSSNTAVAVITSSGAVQIVGVGTTQITASQVASTTYSAPPPVTQPFTVTPAPLTITADNQSTEYEVGIPPLTVSYSGFVYSDSQSSLTTQPMVTTTATVSSVAGTYPITASGAADPNYTITYVPGTLTIDAVAPTAVTQAATAISSSGATLNGTVSDGGASTTVQFLFGTDPHLTGATTVAVTTGASPIAAGTGTVAFTAVMTGLNPGTTYYYEITGANSAGPLGGGILSFTTATIPVAVITFTSPTTAVYGAGDLTPNATSNSDGAPITYTSSNPGVASITDNGEIHVAGAGATQLTASQAAGGGFAAATPVILTLTVTPAPLSVTASSPTAVYGAGIPAITVSYTGFVNGDTQSSLTTAATGSTTATGRSGVGNYPTTAGGAVDPNYAITYVPGNLSITPAPLTVTANNQTITTGSAIPALTVSYSGFVNDDDAGNLTTAPTVATSATPASGPGQYPITVSGAADPNYTITYVPGTLTITAPLVFNTIGSKTYGNPDFNPGATGTDVTYSSGTTSVATITDGGLIHITGAGTSVITATGGGTTIQQTLTVLPAPLIITANDQTRVYNTDNPALTVSYSGFVYSDNAASLTTAVTVATTADISSDAGTYPITASGASDPNYTITYVGGTLTVTKASQTISFAAIPDQVINGHYDLANVSASSGLPVSFALSDPSIAMVSGSTLISLQVGSETLTASQAGNGNYAPAVNAAQSFKIIDDSGNDVIVNQVVSPNGDGIDDVLNIKNIENYPDNKLTLVNRDGVMIYQATGYNNTSRAFDGHSSVTGTLQQQGTLLYILEFTVNGQYHRKTGFTVLRY